MLLLIRTTHRPATDLGYLLRKHPDRVVEAALPSGTARHFFPEATAEGCTAALWVDVDPVGLVRGSDARREDSFALRPYVNDRPYAASSLLSVAINHVWRSAMSGACPERPDLAAAPIPLSATLPAVACHGGRRLLARLFAPLGYAVEASPADPHTPEADARAWSLRLSHTLPLSTLLRHLYVLIPVMDDEKHYWVGEQEGEKLLRQGEGWLHAHPERDLIARRFLSHQRRLYRPALERMDAADADANTAADAAVNPAPGAPADATAPDPEQALEAPLRLDDLRREAVAQILIGAGAWSVLDLGCGEGKLLHRLAQDRRFRSLLGVDPSPRALERAADRLRLKEQLPGPDHDRAHPDGRRAVFVGDLVDRGPGSPAVLRRAMAMVRAGHALCVPGNHEARLVRALSRDSKPDATGKPHAKPTGKAIKPTHGLQETLDQLAQEPPAFLAEIRDFLDGLVSHLVLDGGRLVVAHAGLPAAMHGRSSAAVRDFALYGQTTGETDEFGLPVRYPWASDYRGRALVAYGHTPVPEPLWENDTVCLDTGCVFGGRLSALRWPEREIVAVPALREWYPPARPLSHGRTAESASKTEVTSEKKADTPPDSRPHDPRHLPDWGELLSRYRVVTEDGPVVTISAEDAAGALEAAARFNVEPGWMIYLPPTMSPCETVPGGIGPDGGPWLERPEQAIGHYRAQGAGRLVCEQKHMGSRAVAVVCRDAGVGRDRFGIEAPGRIFTRTGRPFFSDPAAEAAVLARLAAALTRAGTWERLQTGWACLDMEIMPWSVKAQSLIRDQYAPVGAAAAAHLAALQDALSRAAARTAPGGAPLPDLAVLAAHLPRQQARAAAVAGYNRAWPRYCWPAPAVDDLKIAPFHLLATEGRCWMDTDHGWHLAELARLADHDPLLLATAHRIVDPADPASEAAAVAWWEQITGDGPGGQDGQDGGQDGQDGGQEGMVVKPWEFTLRGPRGLLQPAVKCRGRSYLRIIYGPEYTLPDQLPRLLSRGLGAKRALATREFLLGREGLRRFVRGEPISRVFPCSFGVLALESEPVDPRL